ncbi:MAG: MFS transporter [Lachnospiraceae bacterium]|nr:MFS transporter [Lachnospiraceae bacterium]
MGSLLLAIIYLAFISLGLPDSLLGSAWPAMYRDLNAPISCAGMISMTIAAGTIVSSLFSDKMTKKLGTGRLTAASVLLTAAAMFGFSVSHSVVMLFLLAIPYGLGAGAIDAALNNYVALHYNSRHMSWLHCFWGVGASISPYIMGYAIGNGNGWRSGYGIVSAIQIVITAILFCSLPLWKERSSDEAGGRGAENECERADNSGAGECRHPEISLRLRDAWKIKGVPFVLFAFFGYCAFESTCGLWAGSYLVEYRGLDSQTAATFSSLLFLGITAGRFVSGFVADRIGDHGMIRIGLSTALAGIVLIALPVPTSVTALVGLVIIGIGAAPVYPSIIHATPDNFGKENSQAIIGIQMASAYVGTTFMPPVFGLIAEHISIGWYPYYLTVFAVVAFVMLERLNQMKK